MLYFQILLKIGIAVYEALDFNLPQDDECIISQDLHDLISLMTYEGKKWSHFERHSFKFMREIRRNIGISLRSSHVNLHGHCYRSVIDKGMWEISLESVEKFFCSHDFIVFSGNASSCGIPPKQSEGQRSSMMASPRELCILAARTWDDRSGYIFMLISNTREALQWDIVNCARLMRSLNLMNAISMWSHDYIGWLCSSRIVASRT